MQMSLRAKKKKITHNICNKDERRQIYHCY